MALISVVVPCYNEEEALPCFLDALRTTAAELYTEFDCATELLFVDDGSRDATLSVLRGAARADSMVHYLSFSRNFGKEAAMFAGLQHARGDYVVIMDADLQHPPAMLREMVSILRT
ncbi:MAG: glycosyltransferase family 2 protein, partial [Oscillibacter sp.]|nr:glycosyltransferase family 2 protein [Oscillibacter sp.]